MSIPDPAVVKEFLEGELKRVLDRKHVRHAVIGVENGDRTIRWIGAGGMATPGGAPFQADTPFNIASVTKLHIAASVMKLQERGDVDLAGAITDYLPASMVKGIHMLNGKDHSERITIRHLLSHSSGLPDWLEDRPEKGKSLLETLEDQEDRLISIDEAAAFVRSQLKLHLPAQDFGQKKIRIRYSDTNFQLLIALLERQAGASIHEVFSDLIYKPLGLRHTFHPGQQPVEATPEPAVVWMGDKPFSQPLLLQSFRDLYSTAEDLLAFMRGLVRGELFREPDTFALMQQWNRFGFPLDPASFRQPKWPIEYGLGLMRFEMPRLFAPLRPTPAVVGHTGASGSWLFYCPKRDLYLCGTVDQLAETALPYSLVPRLLKAIP